MGIYSAEEAREQTIHALATSAVFDRRARSLKGWLKATSFVGLAGPLIVGSLALAGVKLQDGVLTAVGIGLTVQIAVFGWSLVANWEGALEHASEARASNRELANRYRMCILVQPSPADWATIEQQRFDQERADEKQGVSSVELRYGMRKALRQDKFPCSRCDQVPEDLEPTQCTVCGNFPKSWAKS